MKGYISTLAPEAREKFQAFLAECDAQGHHMLVYCGRRSLEKHARLFRRSRTILEVGHKVDALRGDGFGFLADVLERVGPQAQGPWATDAAPGESWHNYGMAIDAVLVVDGKPDWNVHFLPEWGEVGKIAEAHGLEWGGAWKGRDYVHFQSGHGRNPLDNLAPEQARQILGVGGGV